MCQGPDAIYWLQIFAIRVRTGRLSASHKPVRADTVADALAHVGSAHTMANRLDPRYVPGTTTIHPQLSRVLNGFRKKDSAPSRVLPIPVQVLQRAFAIALLQNTLLALGAADLIWLAFFFLLCPGEYTITGGPFRLGSGHHCSSPPRRLGILPCQQQCATTSHSPESPTPYWRLCTVRARCRRKYHQTNGPLEI
jgi:hypothetical protein